MTILGRTSGIEYRFQFLPFASYVVAFGEKEVEVLLQIFMNVVLFVPFGIFLPCCFERYEKNKVLFLTAVASSFGIELFQGVTRIGLFEVDDIFGNVLGAEIGYLIWKVMRMMWRWVLLKRKVGKLKS